MSAAAASFMRSRSSAGCRNARVRRSSARGGRRAEVAVVPLAGVVAGVEPVGRRLGREDGHRRRQQPVERRPQPARVDGLVGREVGHLAARVDARRRSGPSPRRPPARRAPSPARPRRRPGTVGPTRWACQPRKSVPSYSISRRVVGTSAGGRGPESAGGHEKFRPASPRPTGAGGGRGAPCRPPRAPLHVFVRHHRARRRRRRRRPGRGGLRRRRRRHARPRRRPPAAPPPQPDALGAGPAGGRAGRRGRAGGLVGVATPSAPPARTPRRATGPWRAWSWRRRSRPTPTASPPTWSRPSASGAGVEGRAGQRAGLGDRDHRPAGRGAPADGPAHRLHLGRQRFPGGRPRRHGAVGRALPGLPGRS